jgi:Ni,Fe-hydrogenase I large subunit
VNTASTISVAQVRANLKEHVTHSRYDDSSAAALAAGYTGTGISDPLTVTRTIPVRTAATDVTGTAKYSWLKAPRWNGAPMEVGPMARMFVQGKFKNSTLLATSLGTAFTQYAIAYNPAFPGAVNLLGGIALRPSMIAPDLAVGLARAGLAELRKQVDGTLVALPATKQGIVDAYTNTGTGAQGQLVITGPVTSFILNLKAGLSTMDRLRGRAIESLVLVGKLATWNTALAGTSVGDATYRHVAVPTTAKDGFGAVEAPRGALMHAIHIDGGKITAYQCIVPTTWNGSPKDAATPTAKRGPMEEAMIGIPYDAAGATFYTQADMASLVVPRPKTGTSQGGVEALRVAQSFDPCIACAVH